jgi:hypothetical protein
VTAGLSILAMLVGKIWPYCDLHLWLEAQIDARMKEPMDETGLTEFCREMRTDINLQCAEVDKMYARIAMDYETDIDTAEEELPGLTERLEVEVEPEYQRANEQMLEVKNACSTHRHTKKIIFILYLVMLVVFAVIDFPMQLAAFVMEGLVGWQTWVVCAGIAVITAVLAHVVGDLVNKDNKGWRVFAILICVGVVILFAAIAVLRMASFEYLSQKYQIDKIAASPMIAAVVYFIINLLIFTAASIFSTLIQQKWKEDEKNGECRRVRKEASKRFLAASEDKEKTKKRISNAKAFLNNARHHFGGLQEEKDAQKTILGEVFNKRVRVYRKTYLRTLRR